MVMAINTWGDEQRLDPPGTTVAGCLFDTHQMRQNDDV